MNEKSVLAALEAAESALTQAFTDEANCCGLHVLKGHHGPRAVGDCFELWTKQPQHFEALTMVRAAIVALGGEVS